MSAARWIRLGAVQAEGRDATGRSIAAVQAPADSPVVLWAEPALGCPHPSTGACDDFVDPAALLHSATLVVPRGRAPGLAVRWIQWALAPLVAAYRAFGIRAHFDTCSGGAVAGEVRLASATATAVAGSLIATMTIDLSVLVPLPLVMSTPGALSNGRWRPLRAVGPGDFEAELQRRMESQYDWQIDHAWPDERERRAIAAAQASPASV